MSEILRTRQRDKNRYSWNRNFKNGRTRRMEDVRNSCRAGEIIIIIIIYIS